MNLPGVNVTFSEKAATLVKRGERGIVAMIVKDTVTAVNPIEIVSAAEIPASYNAANRKLIQLALIGYINAPKKVLVYTIPETEEADEMEANYAEALNALEVIKFDWFVAPTSQTDAQTSAIASWIKSMRANGKKVKAVLANTAADHEAVINSATELAAEGEQTYTAEEYTARCAGLIAGTPITISCTFAPLPELTDCTRLTRSQLNTAIDAGKFVLFHDGDKVKVARGVTSLTTTTEDKGNAYKKIKIVEAMDMIHDDITKTIEDSYIGKFANSFKNKCLLIGAVSNYFDQLIREGVLSQAEVDIDIEANRSYLKGKGIDTSDMSDEDIRKADTDDKVYLRAAIKILDAIEEVYLPIAI